ncbi:tetratricopeptide repeat protein 16 isoform X2 [Xenopus laevis]|uniref:Tetratricopeptide repeat protein 16 isoform X2 n=1 Tax=Xenopus laevis TaxID=8355 RepID=A0A8J0VCT2_XENLA|nr:tetratricopeptide repeat protein 16 isoform X2 [Xenopus laevis]
MDNRYPGSKTEGKREAVEQIPEQSIEPKGRLQRYHETQAIMRLEGPQHGQLSNDKKKIFSFTLGMLNQHIDEIADQLSGIQHAKDTEKDSCEAQLAEVQRDLEHIKEQLNLENLLLGNSQPASLTMESGMEKLTVLEETTVQKEEVMNNIALLEEKVKQLKKKTLLAHDRQHGSPVVNGSDSEPCYQTEDLRLESKQDMVQGQLLSTSVNEGDILQAQKKKIFGSSQIFLNMEDKYFKIQPISFSNVVQDKVTQHYERGLKHMSTQQYESAVVSFSKAIELNPEKAKHYIKRSEAFLQLCDFKSAALNLQKACSFTQPRKEYTELLAFIFYLQGQCLFERECYLDALEYFTRSSELQPLNKQCHLCSISCLAALGRHAECIRLVTKWLEEEQGNPDLYVVRARLYDYLNQHTVACTMQEKLMAKAEEAKMKAINHAVQGHFHEALKKICIALEYSPSSAEYHVFRGTVYRKLKDFSPAVDDLVLAMNLCDAQEPLEMQLHSEAELQLHLTYNDFAVHCYTKGFYQEGVLLLNKALNGEQNKKELYVNRGDCFFQLGELSFALADYEQALELDSTNWGIHTRIAKLLDELGLKTQQSRQYQQAELHFSEAIKHQPLLPQLFLHRSQVRHYLQNITDAQMDAVISILLHPNSNEALLTVMKFFPGKSLEEILRSKLANAAQCVLHRSLRELPVAWREHIHSFGKPEVEASGSKNSGSKLEINTCLSDQQLMAELIKARRSYDSNIQEALNSKGPFQSHGPHLPKISRPENKNPQASHTWKTLSFRETHVG